MKTGHFDKLAGRAFVLAVWVLMLLVFAAGLHAAENAGPKPPIAFVPLPELLRKWGDVPLEAVQRAAESGDLTAQHYLGYCYVEGIRVSPNPALAVRWYERAGKSGYLPSWNNLGLLYQRGKGVSVDLSKALEYYRRAADAGLPKAQANLGLLYETQGDMQQAWSLLRQAAEHDESEAMVWLYSAYLTGKGVAPDPTEAIKWLTKAAEGGNAHAQCLLGYHYANPHWESSDTGDRLPPPNMPEALRWYRRAADQNWAGSQYYLGLCYLEGNGVDQDEAYGLELIRKAADQNHVYAMVELANLYTGGVGAPRSEPDHPIPILQRVIRRDPEGNESPISEAYEALILRYEHGIGTERDVIAAVEWQSRAALVGARNFSLTEKATRGFPKYGLFGSFGGEPGRSIIQVMTPDSTGRTVAFNGLLALYLKAAGGDGQATAQIGNSYLTGQDAPKSPVRAWLWFTVAARNGAGNASNTLSRIETGMTTDEAKEGKLRLPEFIQHLSDVAKQIRIEAAPETQ